MKFLRNFWSRLKGSVPCPGCGRPLTIGMAVSSRTASKAAWCSHGDFVGFWNPYIGAYENLTEAQARSRTLAMLTKIRREEMP